MLPRSFGTLVLASLLLCLVTACAAESPAPQDTPTQRAAAHDPHHGHDHAHDHGHDHDHGEVPTDIVEGRDYFVIEPAVPTRSGDRIEIVEVFGYTCVHCANIQPLVDDWKPGLPADVQFEYVPAVWGGAWEAFARAFYTAQTMGVLERSHNAMFEAIHAERRNFRSLDDIAGFYTDYGVTREQFLATMQSFPVEAKISEARERVQGYGVEGTPTFVVQGRYRVPPGPGGHPRMLRVVEHLVAQERAGAAD